MFTSSHACTTASGGGVEGGGFCPPIEEDTDGPEHSLRLVPLPQQRNVASYLSNAPKAVWAGLDLGCRHRPGHGTISWLAHCSITGPEDRSRTEGCVCLSVLTCGWIKLAPSWLCMKLNYVLTHPWSMSFFFFFKYYTRLAVGLVCISPADKRSSCASSDFSTWKDRENFLETYTNPKRGILSWTTDFWGSHLFCAWAAR